MSINSDCKLARSLLKEKKYRQTAAFLTTRLEEHSTQPSLLNLLAESYAGIGNWELAAVTYERSLELIEHPWIRAQWAWARLKSGDLGTAKEIFEQLHQENPNDPVYASFFAHALNECGDTENAITLLKEKIHQFPNEAGLYSRLGSVYVSIQRIDEAIEAFLTSFRLNPENSYFNIKIAECYMEKNDWKGAKKYFLDYLSQRYDEDTLKRYCEKCLKYGDINALKDVKNDMKHLYLQNALVPDVAHKLYGDIPHYEKNYFSHVRDGFAKTFRAGAVGYADYLSKYLNNRDGVRVTTGQPELFDDQIFIFGDSIANGFAVEDNHTIASILQGF